MRLFAHRMSARSTITPDKDGVSENDCSSSQRRSSLIECKDVGEPVKDSIESSSKTAQNPIVSVSDEYMRVVGMSQPLKKFLTRNNTRPNGMVPITSCVHYGVHLSNGIAKAERLFQESEVDGSIITARQIKAAKQTVSREQLQQRY